MNTICPDCGKPFPREEIEKHLAAHDLADLIEKTIMEGTGE